MTRAPHPALAAQLLALADDELILGHRDSEWCGHAPILEEDIAFANLAQDELGHAALWYELAEPLLGRTTDALIFWRGATDYRCAQLVTLPKGDWAHAMLRQFLFDAAEAVRLPRLAASAYAPLAERAAKVRTEELYHLRHTQAWVRRLGLGTAESHRRMQIALNTLWPYALQLFVPLPDEAALTAEGIVPDAAEVRAAWEALAGEALRGAGLAAPAGTAPAGLDRQTPGPHLPALLDEMQSVARLEGPEVGW
ncbi:MAG: phenylacetate-CoA oxygenase subunit PaaC [Anaerolineales bacterium]|nr:phenylacetate-CoA oxygenase subunit PaaC [Anaerolineales bacterium]